MNYIFFLFFIFLVSCGTGKKTYICGERSCIDKKEFKEYFAENLTVEIKSKRSNKQNNIDLVRLNSKIISKNEDNYSRKTQVDKLNKKEEKARLKAERLSLRNERKIKKINEKKSKIKQKKLKKLKNKKNNLTILGSEDKMPLETVSVSTKETKQINKKNIIKPEIFKSIKTQNQVSLCDKIKDCDINKIADLLTEQNNKKEFPDLSLK
jgi:flagellar biosynthesis GTPase FlhF